MNICIICPEMGNSGGSAFIGGHVNIVTHLSKALFDWGHKISIITTPHRYPNQPGGSSLEWAEVFCLQTSAPYLSTRYGLDFALKSRQKIRELQPTKKFDVVHGHSGYSMPALITGIAGRLGHIPSVHTIYSPIQPVIGRNIVRSLSNKALSRFYLSKIDKVIAVTENVESSLLNTGISSRKIELVPPGIDTSLYNPSICGDEVRAELNINQGQPTLCYVGNLTRTKGLHILVESLKIVVKKYPEVKLLMVLNMPLSKYENPGRIAVDMELIFDIKKAINFYGLDDNVIPIGLTDKLPQIMAASDVFITPFLNTVGVVDYPIALLEAMAIGKPVIASDIGGISEILSHNQNGLLVDPNNPFKLADAILFTLENKEKAKRMGSKGTELISTKFKLEIMVDKLEEIYKEIRKG